MGIQYAQDFSRGLQLSEEALQSLPEAERAYQSVGENNMPMNISQFRIYSRIVPLWQMGVAYEKLGQKEKSCSLYKDALIRAKEAKEVPYSRFLPLIKKSIDNLSPGCQK